VNSNNPGSHATPQNGNPCSSPNTTTTTPAAAPATMPSTTNGGMEMNALTNNPNGSNWIDKFNRPGVAMTVHHKTKHHAKRASGGGH